MRSSTRRAQFLSFQLADYRCLHFATHGSSVLGASAVDNPLQACIYLRDGALTAWDVSAVADALRAHLRDRKRARDVFFWAPFFVSSLGAT